MAEAKWRMSGFNLLCFLSVLTPDPSRFYQGLIEKGKKIILYSYKSDTSPNKYPAVVQRDALIKVENH